MQKKYGFIPLVVLLFLLDTGYSFRQYLGHSLDGDIAPIVLPSKHYQPIMEHPFGLPALLEGKRYAGTNRYFAHRFMASWFREVPHFLQNFCSPVESIYLACAILKTAIHILLLWILARYISVIFPGNKKAFWWSVLCLFPLFQANGYLHIGVIYDTITYTIFYSLSLALMLLFFLPFYEFYFSANSKQRLPDLQKICWLLLAVVLSFSGALIPAIVLLVCPAVVAFLFYKNYTTRPLAFSFLKIKTALQNIPQDLLFFFGFISLLGIYSFFIGTYNLENNSSVPVSERYQFMIKGIFHQITRKLGLPLLLLFIIGNAWLIRKEVFFKKETRILQQLKFVFAFAMIYLVLLPLGGFREYRSDIVRADTFLPITLCLFFVFGQTTYFIAKNLKDRTKKIYLFFIGAFLVLMTIADEPHFYRNQCEKNALKELAASPKKTVRLSNSCTVMGWHKNFKPKQSEINCALLKFWGVLDTDKLYFQKD